MKKLALMMAMAAMSSSAMGASNYQQYCDSIDRIQLWDGSSGQANLYGIRIILDSQASYAGCEGGFFVDSAAPYKEMVYSTLLAADVADIKVCVQMGQVSQSLSGQVCKFNSLSLDK